MISDYAGMWASFITLSLYCMNEVNSTFLISWMKADEQTCSWKYSNSVAETKMLPLLTRSLKMRLVTWQRILLGIMSSVESSYGSFTFVLGHVKRRSPLIFQTASSLHMWLAYTANPEAPEVSFSRYFWTLHKVLKMELRYLRKLFSPSPCPRKKCFWEFVVLPILWNSPEGYTTTSISSRSSFTYNLLAKNISLLLLILTQCA